LFFGAAIVVGAESSAAAMSSVLPLSADLDLPAPVGFLPDGLGAIVSQWG